MGLQDDVDMLNLQDGKRYYMPSLTDKPFYDGGLILREDYLESKGLEAPKTFDDLYEILKAYKADYPDSYPLTILAGPRVLFRMTMPSFRHQRGQKQRRWLLRSEQLITTTRISLLAQLMISAKNTSHS